MLLVKKERERSLKIVNWRKIAGLGLYIFLVLLQVFRKDKLRSRWRFGWFSLYRLSRRCGECNFNICRDCFKHYLTSLHEHALFRACALDVYPKSRGCWRCDNCRSLFRNPNENWPWHCHKCEYDLCDQCIGANPGKKTGDKRDTLWNPVSRNVI